MSHYLVNSTKSTLSKFISIRKVLCSNFYCAKVKLQGFNGFNSADVFLSFT